MSFLDVAEQARNQILGSIDWASTFGNQLNENFVGQQEIPERLTRTRLNNLNNQFGISERLQNWTNDLEASGAESQFNNWYNQYRTNEFDDITRLESLQREADLLQSRANIDNFEQSQKLQNIQQEQAILESEEAIDKMTFDRMYEQLVSSIPDYYSMSPSQRYEAATDLANEQGAPDRVKARIRRKYIESSQEDLENLRKLSGAQQQLSQMERTMAQLSQAGQNIPASMVTAYANMQNDIVGYRTAIRDLEGSARIGLDMGILNPRQVGEILGRPETDFMGLAERFQRSVPLVAKDQPEVAPIQVNSGTPVQQYEAPPAPPAVETGQPVQQYQAPPAPAPQPQPAAPRPITVPYQQDVNLENYARRGSLREGIENDPSFPRDLVGVLSNTQYTSENLPSEISKLIRLRDYIETIPDPSKRRVMEQLWGIKINSLDNFINDNRLDTNG